MARLIFSESASADQINIFRDLYDTAGLKTAVKFRERFASLFDRLLRYPESGARRPALGPFIRIGVVSPFVVIYEHGDSDDTVFILRIIHGRRDIARTLLHGHH